MMQTDSVIGRIKKIKNEKERKETKEFINEIDRMPKILLSIIIKEEILNNHIFKASFKKFINDPEYHKLR